MIDQDDSGLDGYREACIAIDRTDLLSECARLPSDLHFWGERHAEAVQALAEASARTKAAYAAAFVMLDAGIDPRTGKPMAIERVKEYAERDEDYRQASLDEAQAAGARSRLWSIVEAIRAKQNMLQELGATARAEWKATGRYGEPAESETNQ